MNPLWQILSWKTRAMLLHDRRYYIEKSIRAWLGMIIEYHRPERYICKINTALSEYDGYVTGQIYNE